LLEVAQGLEADGVGDACDPRPDSEGDAIAFFDSFEGALGDQWTTVSGTWFTQNGSLRQSDTGVGRRAFVPGASYSNAVYETAFTFDQILSSSDAWAGLAFHLQADFDGLWCGAGRNSGGTGRMLVWPLSNGGAGSSNTGVNIPPTPVVGTRLVQQVTVAGTSYACDIVDRNGFGLTTGYSSGRVGLRTTRVAVSFEYLVVYTTGQ
jgi:hypothetical protein